MEASLRQLILGMAAFSLAALLLFMMMAARSH